MSKLSEYQKRTLIEDVYGPFISAALDQRNQLAKVIIADPGNEEGQFAFKVADRLLGFLQTKEAGEYKKIPADAVKIQVRTNNGKRYHIRQQGGEQALSGLVDNGEGGVDYEPETPAALPDGT